MSYLLNLFNALIILISFILVCIILIQRGRGGGLAGAFGGVGGSSAFGTKAGDVCTRVTIVIAVDWILLSMLLVRLTNLNSHNVGNPALDFGAGSSLSKDLSSSKSTAPGANTGVSTEALPPGSPTTSVAPGTGSNAPAGVAAGTGSLGTPAPTVSVPSSAPAPAPDPAPK